MYYSAVEVYMILLIKIFKNQFAKSGSIPSQQYNEEIPSDFIRKYYFFKKKNEHNEK